MYTQEIPGAKVSEVCSCDTGAKADQERTTLLAERLTFRCGAGTLLKPNRFKIETQVGTGSTGLVNFDGEKIRAGDQQRRTDNFRIVIGGFIFGGSIAQRQRRRCDGGIGGHVAPEYLRAVQVNDSTIVAEQTKYQVGEGGSICRLEPAPEPSCDKFILGVRTISNSGRLVIVSVSKLGRPGGPGVIAVVDGTPRQNLDPHLYREISTPIPAAQGQFGD